MHFYNADIGQLTLHLPKKLIIDNFAGGGGASTGLEQAFGRSVDIAINHDTQAISMHKLNHPDTKHYCESVWDVDPVKACAGMPVEWAHFSPDCTHHSKARGGKPKKKEIRGLAWVLIKWAVLTRPEFVSLENVEEFKTWGPLDPEGHPIPERSGETYRAFLAMLSTGIDVNHPAVDELIEFMPAGFDVGKVVKGLGYSVDTRELRACDYGAPTTRKRLFMIARRDGEPVQWPEPTHGAGLKPYRTAAECIDWSIPCPSIFERKRPLADNTMRRIAKGLMKFVIDCEDPYVLPDKSATAFISKHKFMSAGSAANAPLHTITAGGACARPAGAAHSMALTKVTLAPYIMVNTNNNRAKSVKEPVPTITTSTSRNFLCTAKLAPFIDRQFGTATGNSAADPLGTIMTQGAGGKSALVTPYLVKHYGGNYTGAGIDMRDPVDTITTTDHHALVSAFLIKYYGNDKDGVALDQPLHTITTKERFGLVTVQIAGETYRVIDIGMRMLQPHELYKAQGFPDGYIHDRTFDGASLSKTAQVHMVGNSVPPCLIAAIAKSNLVTEEVSA